MQNTVSPLHKNLQVVNFQRCEHASSSSKEPEPVPLMSGMKEIAACPLSPIADDPSAHSMPAPVFQLLHCTTVLFEVLYYKIKNVSFIFCVCFLCVICVKSIINLLQYSTIIYS